MTHKAGERAGEPAPKITYTHAISPRDYNALRQAVEWKPLPPDQAEAGLKGTAWLVAAQSGGQAVGMARIISDGGYVRYIADVIVRPDHQGQGIGQAMMEQAMAHIKGELKPGHGVTVVLVSAAGREGFYQQFGFQPRPIPGTNQGAGMTQWLDCQK